MHSRQTQLEICTASVTDTVIAEAAGADRVELNTALPLGGLTPSPGMVRLALQQVSIPVIAMARPRESGFCYSEQEFQTLLDDVQWLVEAGVAGVAFGVLDEHGSVDVARCRQVLDRLGENQLAVFHRAFDLVTDKSTALETLIECGVDRVMTSGGAETAWQGRASIAELVRQATNRIEILPAGGIRVDHATNLVAETGVTQIHAGLSEQATDPCYAEGVEVNFYGQLPENPAHFRQSSPQLIQQMAQSLNPHR